MRCMCVLLLSRSSIQPCHESGENNDVDEDEPGGVDVEQKIAAEVDEVERDLEQENEPERLVHGESRGETTVVEVGLVGMKDAFFAQEAADGYAGEIEAGNDQQRVGHEKTVRAEGENVGIVHGVFDGQIGQCIAQDEAAGVAHEGFGALAFGAEHVEQEKRKHAAHQSDGQKGVGNDVEMPKEQGEYGKSYHGKTGRKAVDAVDEVDGVHYEQADEHGEGIAHPKRYFIDAAEAIEVVDVETA